MQFLAKRRVLIISTEISLKDVVINTVEEWRRIRYLIHLKIMVGKNISLVLIWQEWTNYNRKTMKTKMRNVNTKTKMINMNTKTIMHNIFTTRIFI